MTETLDAGEHTVQKTKGWVGQPDDDPFTHWVEGHAAMGNTYFNMPIITPVVDGLWQGGFVDGIHLKHRFDYILSLYPWQKWIIPDGVIRREVTMYDSHAGPEFAQIRELAEWVNTARAKGPTLVHCQAGLNRSALVTAAALILDGMTAKDAIALLRKQRDPAVLCNDTFEKWLGKFEEVVRS